MLMPGHEAFFPPTENCAIWRYMDFTKYVSLLETGRLFLPRADGFEDPYEGAWSAAGVRLLREQSATGGIPQHGVEQLLAFASAQRQAVFLSCWHVGNHESAAMWKLYLQTSEGIAVQSDYESLARVVDASPLNAGISMVQYIDYDKTPIPFGNAFFPFVHKRQSFAHEKELRVVVWRLDSVNEPQIPKDAAFTVLDVDLKQLVKAIYVAPTAPPWFGQLVEQVTRRYGLSVPIVRSNLYDRPSY